MNRAPLNLVEEDVKARVESGDLRCAMAVIEKEYALGVARFVASRAANREDAEDALQEWFVVVMESLSRFRWESSLRTYLFWCARTALKSVERNKQKRARAQGSDESVDVAASANTNTLLLLREIDRQRAKELREHLEDEERAVLSLYVDLELPWDDVVAIMSEIELTPEKRVTERNRVKKLFERAKKKLREIALEKGVTRPVEEMREIAREKKP